jgi:hypothetical protein
LGGPTGPKRRHSYASASRDGGQDEGGGLAVLADKTRFGKLLGLMFIYSFLLGPLLDGYHGLFGVLEYTPGIVLSVGGKALLKTALWVSLHSLGSSLHLGLRTNHFNTR